jgi:hypothetical protein
MDGEGRSKRKEKGLKEAIEKDTLVSERGLGLHEAAPEVAAEEAGAARVLQLARGTVRENPRLGCSGRRCRRRKGGVGGGGLGARPRVGRSDGWEGGGGAATRPKRVPEI